MAGYKPNHRGLGELLRGAELQAEMRRRAEKVEAVAVAEAASFVQTGEYIRSFEVDSGVERDVQGNLRAYGRVRNTSDHAAAVEYGSGGRSTEPTKSAHHTLSRALDFAGD